MEELIAKRYIKAFNEGSNLASMQEITTLFSVLAESFQNEKFVSIIANPSVKAEAKSTLLLDAVKSVDSHKINNFIKLLVENRRINIIPAIAQD